MNHSVRATGAGTQRARLRNRTQAGVLLARRLADHTRRADAIVLAVPCGGVPVGVALAGELAIALDVLVVRRSGVPARPGDAGDADAAAWRRRERLYRGNRPPLNLAGLRAIVVDDGVATGATMLAAIEAARRLGPRTLTVAVPVAAPDTLAMLAARVDHLACLAAPAQCSHHGFFHTYYESFDRISDEEVQDLLAHAWHSAAKPPIQPTGETDHDADDGHRP